MPVPDRQSKSTIVKTEQGVLNASFDELYQVLAFMALGFDGVAMQRNIAECMATKITVSGDVTYIGKAAPGTAQATTKWQAMKIDETSGVVITWADGDADFNNSATDLTSLSYS